MGLKVWLPLDGDLHNQGTSNITAINIPSGVTIDNTGKIGKCYTSSGSAAGVTTSFDFKASQFSIAAWVRINTRVNAWRCPFKLVNNSAADKYQYIGFCCEHNTQATYVGFHFYKTIDGTNTAIFDNYSITDMTVGQWTHLAVTYDGKVATYYKNGIKVSSTTIAAAKQNTVADIDRIIMLGGDGNRGGAAVKSSLNDVRVYDECLSAAEVHEIAQGLVLHYKLDGPMGGSSINLMLNTNAEKSTTYWGNWGPATNRSVVTLNGKKWFHFTASAGASTYGGFYQDNVTTSNQLVIKPNTNYTVSALMYASDDTQCRFWYHIRSTEGGANITQGAKNITVTTTPQIYSYTFNSGTNSTYTINRLNMMIGSAYESTTDHEVYFTEVKLEEGSVSTPWTPAPSEMGIDTTIVEDSSGYNHNGTTIGSVLSSGDTGRYNIATNLVNGASAINCGRGGMVTDSITVNMWLKSSAWANPVSCTEGGGWNFEASGDYFRFPIYISGVGYKYGASTTTRAQLCNNQWHMLTGVYDRPNGHIKIYVDGELDNDYDAGTTNAIGYHSGNVIWIGAEASASATAFASNGMVGLFSDFRIYCTPLLDTDIKQLYNVSMKVDNLGNIHTYELEETNGQNKILKTGITKSANFFEDLYYDEIAHIGKQMNDNILSPNDLEVITTNNSSIKTGSLGVIPAETIQALAGKTLIFSYDVCATGERLSEVNGDTAYNKVRYGIHGSMSYVNASGTSGTNYPFTSYLTYSGNSKHTIQIWTIPTNYQSYGSLSFAIQNFDMPSNNNSNTWFIKNVRLEVQENTANGWISGTNLIEM